MSSPTNISPVNPLPPVVVALFIVMVLIEARFTLGSRGLLGGPEAVGWRLDALRTYGFSGDIFDWMVENRQFPKEHMLRFVSYLFVHGSFTQTLFSGVMLLALGKFVGEVFAGWAVVAVFIVSGIGGALAYGAFLDVRFPLFGAFPGVYGLIGAFTYVLWLRLGQMGERQITAFRMIGFLMGIQLLFALIAGGNSDWVADVAGFVTGFSLSIFVIPGGWSKIRAKLRHE